MKSPEVFGEAGPSGAGLEPIGATGSVGRWRQRTPVRVRGVGPMSGRMEGKVALVTGAARGQGRSHAVRLAEEGANIIAVDVCQDMGSIPYSMATPDDLEVTAERVREFGRQAVTGQADVRDAAALEYVVRQGVDELGGLDAVCANAGVFATGRLEDITIDAWNEVLSVNLTGTWITCKVAIPFLRVGGAGGSIVVTSSTAGVRGLPNSGHYVASKHGVIGMMRTLANELAAESIRVNAVLPTSCDTPMLHNDALYSLFLPGAEHPSREEFADAAIRTHTLPVAWVDPLDVSNAVLFLASDEARYITGAILPVDAGSGQR